LAGVQRALEVLEAVAEHQPVGVAELSRILSEDKSAVQRALVTLHASGWILPAGERLTSWQLSARPLILASRSRALSGLLARARPVLEDLVAATGETAMLAIPEAGRVVAVEVVESPHLVRAAPRIGMVLPPDTSAAGLALFAALPAERIAEFGVDPADPRLAAELARTRERGWSLNAGAVASDVTAVSAAVLDAAGRPVAAIVLSAPSSRLPPSREPEAGTRVAAAATTLSGHRR
jgi:IclR family acetate operon transcriptional repressor